MKIRLCADCKEKSSAKGRTICNCCRSRRSKLKHPFKYAYNNLKQNAKRRNKEFALSFEKFKELAIESDYINKKGRTKHSLHIDRIRELDGYTDDNVQALENHLNVKKYIEFSHIDKNNKKTFKTRTTKNIQHDGNYEDCPF